MRRYITRCRLNSVSSTTIIATAGRLFNRVRGRCEQGGIRAMYVYVCSFVQIDLLSAKCRSTVSSVAFLIGAAILFLHVPRRWADGARGARVRGIVALEIVRFSGAGLFGLCRGRRAGAGGGARPYTGTPSRGAASVRFHRRGQSASAVTRRDRFGARRTRDAEVRHSAAPRAAGAVLPLRHAAGGCHARSGRPARTGGSRRHKTYRLARRPNGTTTN